jgi:hypothetical protein
MGVNASRTKFMIDEDAGVLLRDIDDGAETSTATETAVSLNELDGAYWMDGKEIPHGIIAVQINVTACDDTDGTETYTLSLQVDDAAAMNDSPVTVWSQAVQRGFTGVLYAYVDSKNIPALDTDSSGTDKWIAIKATLGGDTPSITYGAVMAKSIKS